MLKRDSGYSVVGDFIMMAAFRYWPQNDCIGDFFSEKPWSSTFQNCHQYPSSTSMLPGFPFNEQPITINNNLGAYDRVG